jgi:phospholipid-translocating ATPase
MSFLRQHPPHPDDLDNTDEENDGTIDPELRLRTVRTAASAIAESIRSEVRAQKRKTARQRKSGFFRKNEKKRHTQSKDSIIEGARTKVVGERRNVYVNQPLSATEVDYNGEPTARYARNKVRTSSESCQAGFKRSETQLLVRIYTPFISSHESFRTISTVRITLKYQHENRS